MALTSMQGSLEAAVQVVDQSNQEVETHADKAPRCSQKMRDPFLSSDQNPGDLFIFLGDE